MGKNGNYGDNKPVNLGVVKATSYVWDQGFRIELFNTGEKTLTVKWAGRTHPLYPNHTLEISHSLGNGMAFIIDGFYYELKFLR